LTTENLSPPARQWWKQLSTRLSVRVLMIFVASVAITLATAKRLIVGDGGLDIEIVNGLGRPIRDIQLSCKGRVLDKVELVPGAVMRGRLWPADFRRGGLLDGEFGMTCSIDGVSRHWTPGFSFDLLHCEPSLRIKFDEKNGKIVYLVRGSRLPVLEPRKTLRSWWFRLFPPELGSDRA
jgi:hypothetical protein